MDFAEKTTTPTTVVPFRLMRSIWRQSARTPECPTTPRLEGKVALVTGGNAGIGLEISRGLAQRGAEVIIAARNRATSEEACSSIGRETGAPMRYVSLDLSDLESVVNATEEIQATVGDRRVAICVANAGIWPKAYAKSPQGHEIAFATNTLGHHVLLRRLIDREVLATDARVVVQTGDIYIRAKECTSDFHYDGSGGGSLAYSRSKLGNIWFTRELQKRHPKLEVCVVHPGVIASGLSGPSSGFGAFMQDLMMLDVRRGAQTPLWCATQPNVERGGYYHNTMGRLLLGDGDAGADAGKAAALWERLEELGAAFV